MPLDTNPAKSSGFTEVSGHQIAWRSTGTGRPLLMLNRFRRLG